MDWELFFIVCEAFNRTLLLLLVAGAVVGLFWVLSGMWQQRRRARRMVHITGGVACIEGRVVTFRDEDLLVRIEQGGVLAMHNGQVGFYALGQALPPGAVVICEVTP
jgi:hypothetical protein